MLNFSSNELLRDFVAVISNNVGTDIIQCAKQWILTRTVLRSHKTVESRGKEREREREREIQIRSDPSFEPKNSILMTSISSRIRTNSMIGRTTFSCLMAERTLWVVFRKCTDSLYPHFKVTSLRQNQFTNFVLFCPWRSFVFFD